MAMAILWLLFYIVAVIIGLLFYLIGSYGLMKMAEQAQLENCWLAFVPIGNLYLMGKIIRNLQIGSQVIKNIELILPLVSIVCYLLKGIPLLSWLISLAATIFFFMALYKMFRLYNKEKADVFIILSVILPISWITIPLILFSLGKHTPNYSLYQSSETANHDNNFTA